MKQIIALALVAVSLFACTKTEQTVIRDSTNAVCEIVFQATDPALAPICTTVDLLEEVIMDLVAKKAAAHPGAELTWPTQDEIYAALKARK